jgi:hypothetical protein
VAAKPSRFSINAYYRGLWRWLMLRARVVEAQNELDTASAELREFEERVLPTIREDHFPIKKTGAKVIPLQKLEEIANDAERLRAGAEHFRNLSTQYSD